MSVCGIDDIDDLTADHGDSDGTVQDDTGDFLNGGSGDDVIIAGQDDNVTAGDGADTIIGGAWITEGHAANITDFNAEDDNILLVYDDDDPEPAIALQPDQDETGTTQVLMNGVMVASIGNGALISIEDIAVMPLSIAQASGMMQ